MTALRKYNEEPPEFWPRDGRTRIYLQRSGLYGVRILPGETYATADPKEAIVTVLASCVSACVRDPATGFGGMNHFMLPESETGVWGDGLSAAARYGNFAMEALINLVLKAGCPRSRLEIKLFGGANFTAGPAHDRQEEQRLCAALPGRGRFGRHCGRPRGIYGRRIHYHPATGKVARLFLKETSEKRVVEEERQYGKALQATSVEGGAELFD